MYAVALVLRILKRPSGNVRYRTVLYAKSGTEQDRFKQALITLKNQSPGMLFEILWRALQVASLALLIAGFFVVGFAMSSELNDENLAEFGAEFSEEPLLRAGNLGLFYVAYEFATPSIPYEWMGDPNRQAWLWEQFPMPNSKDVIFLVPFGIALMALSKVFWHASQWHPLAKALTIIAGILLLFLLGWIVFKTVAYYTMVYQAEQLGIERSVLDTMREAEWTHLQRVGIWNSLVLTAIFALVLIPSVINKVKRRS